METCKYGLGASTRKPPTARWVWRWVLSPHNDIRNNQKKKETTCQTADLQERTFTHGGYFHLTPLQVTFYFPVYLPDKRLQLSVQLIVTHGEAVGLCC